MGQMGGKRYSIHPHVYILRVDDPHDLFPQPSPPPRSHAQVISATVHDT